MEKDGSNCSIYLPVIQALFTAQSIWSHSLGIITVLIYKLAAYPACPQRQGFWGCLQWIHMLYVWHRFPMFPQTPVLRPLTRWPLKPDHCVLNRQRGSVWRSQHILETRRERERIVLNKKERLWTCSFCEWKFLLIHFTLQQHYAPINVKPHYPPCGQCRGICRGISPENSPRGYGISNQDIPWSACMCACVHTGWWFWRT